MGSRVIVATVAPGAVLWTAARRGAEGPGALPPRASAASSRSITSFIVAGRFSFSLAIIETTSFSTSGKIVGTTFQRGANVPASFCFWISKSERPAKGRTPTRSS